MNKLSNTAEQILSCARTLIVAGGYNGFSSVSYTHLTLPTKA